MKYILVLGAGRSSSCLIDYLLKEATVSDWHIIVGDLSVNAAQERVGSHQRGSAIYFSIDDATLSRTWIEKADCVISLLPAFLHPKVALICLDLQKHLLTASYVSPDMKAMHEAAQDKGLLFLNECGLDPGIDHMSAKEIIDKIQDKKGKLISFESYTGGLIAPETDPENPWRYKFTWNARNVVMAGQGTAKFLQNGKLKYVPYQQLFKRTTAVEVPGFGWYEGYANRDSLQYIETYGLKDIETMIRGTLRNKGYCDAWHTLVQLGCCDESYTIENLNEMTHQSFVEMFLPAGQGSAEDRFCHQFKLDKYGEEMERLRWSGFFSDEKITLTQATPALVVEHILSKRWTLSPEDKDMIVMWHRFTYTLDNQLHEVQASLVAKGDDAIFTAMAKTVGWPLAIAAKLLMQGKIAQRGVCLPIMPSLYQPILKELDTLGIRMHEEEKRLK
ncbi:MAG: saccharopine dehydrogenase [Cytophagia bacterium]|nr:saccharopine dehydrogenase [Cytophagia bacterium]NBW35421.1 saccharopine dehydrogenase [Cytophagia bacterium]